MVTTGYKVKNVYRRYVFSSDGFNLKYTGISNATKAFFIGDIDSSDTMVIRMNGSGTDDFLDRKHEVNLKPQGTVECN